MTRRQLAERIMWLVDGCRFGEWDLAEAFARIHRLLYAHRDLL